MRLYQDRAFRIIFGTDSKESKEALIALLNAVLGLDEDPIIEVEITNPLNLTDNIEKKEIIMDINAKTRRGMLFDVEMQTGNYEYYLDRVVFNGARLTAGALDKGEDYDKMKKSIVISFIRDTVFSEVKGFHNVAHMTLDETGRIISDREEFHFIELGKISDAINLNDASSLELLALFIKYAEDEGKEDYVKKILATGSEAVSKADRRLSMVTEEERKEAEKWSERLYEHDMATIKKIAEEKAKKEIKEEIKEEAKKEIKEEVKEEVKEELKEELKEEVKEELKEELKEKVTVEVTEKVTEEVTERVTEEVTERVTEEVTKKVTNEGIEKLVETLKELGTKECEIVSILMDKYELTLPEAESYAGK